MDKWESSIEEYQAAQTLDSFSAVLHSAENILKEDLAPFEIDWFIQTLLAEPVSLLLTVSARLTDNAWSKVVKDSYKILSSLVDSFYDALVLYVDDIVKLCQKPQDPRTRSHALQCLAACVRRIPEGSATELAAVYTTELRQPSTCKAPLALLVGAICEHLPSTVTGRVNTIWRNYLNLLRFDKNTDHVTTSILKGIWCLFKHFGTEIPVRELTEFYDKLKEFMYCSENAVLAILRDYAGLFKEKLAEDAILRRDLWTYKDLSAVLPVYLEIGTVLTKEQMQKIFRREIAPKTSESYANLRFTALRVSVALQSRYDVFVGDVLNVDVYSLEFELRRDTSYDVAEAVAWCIEANIVNSEKLLQTAMIFYSNIPAIKRKDIVVKGLLNAPVDVMNNTLTFLINETCESETALYTLLPVWRDLFASQTDGQRALFEKYMEYVLFVVNNYLEEVGDDKTLPEKLATLLTLTSHVLTLQPVEDYTSDECALVSTKLVDLCRECGLQAAIMAVVRAITPHLEDIHTIKKIYEMIRIDKCKDEALLCECCLALIQSPTEHDSTPMLMALEVIFSRKDAEAKTLSLAIHKLEKLIVDENNNWNKSSVSKCVHLIEKLRTRKDLVGKDARVLQRDVTMFLGKYFNLHGFGDASNEDNLLIVNLKDALSVNIPNPIEGSTYKINLNRILHLALVREHEESLLMLLNIICANLCANKSVVLQSALGRVVVSLCRTTVGTARPKVARQVAAFCDVDATLYIIKQISTEKSPAVRSMLSETVEGILLSETGSRGDAVIIAASDHATSMMGSRDSVLKQGGLDITGSLLPALKANRHQTKTLLPSLMICIAKTYEPTSSKLFEHSSNLYIENIGLFCPDAQGNITNDLIKILVNTDQDLINDDQVKVHKDLMKIVLSFLRKLLGDDVSKLIGNIFELQGNSDCIKCVYLWSQIPNYFVLSKEQVTEIMDFENSAVLDKIFEVNARNNFGLETHLVFVIQFAEVLFKLHSSRTVKYIGQVIESLSPTQVKTQRKNLSKCLSVIRQTLHTTPDSILKSLESWTEQLPLKEITEHLEKEKFTPDHALYVNALKIMLDIFKLKDPTPIVTTVSIFAKTWPKTVLHVYASRIKYLKKETPQLSDLLSVSLRFLTVTDVKKLILEGHGLPGVENAKVGVELCRYFMSVFAIYLVRKPFLLVDRDMEACSELLNDVVKWSVRKRWRDDRVENVLELVDLLWPTYEQATFKLKHSLLLDLSSLHIKVGAHSPAMRWATGVLRSDEASRDDRIKIVGVLPGGDEYSDAYLRFASLLPTRLSDMEGVSRAALRALLDALSGGLQRTLLDVAIKLADGDETVGWWDEALPSCMASLALLPTLTPELVVYVYSSSKASAAVCRRLLVPLIRNSPTPIAEKFFASVLSELISGLSSGLKAPSTHPEYSACVRQKTSVLDILQVLFEKISPDKIESPSSSLYENMQTDRPWHVAREVIRLSHELRKKLTAPSGAEPALLGVCREFQYSAYKCMCACVCVRRPGAHIYTTVMSVSLWERIVDRNAKYELPLKTQWNTQKIRSSVSISTPNSRRSRSLSRSRIFLRTLSENPFDYDLIHHEENDTDPQDIEIPDSSLNQHACAGTLTALFRHCAPLTHYVWRDSLAAALETDNRNLAWLLGQAICNCREDLKPHAIQLRPGLFAVAANSAMEGKYLNSLHIDILNTLIHWRDDSELSAVTLTHVNTAVNCLIYTALENVTRTNIFRMLDGVLDNTLKAYGGRLDGMELVLDDVGQFLDDPNRANACLKLLYKFGLNKVRTPGLLSLLLKKLNDNHKVYKREMTILSELIGLLISNSNERDKTEAGAKLKETLEKVRKNNSIADFVRFLYYSGCCDQQQFRTIVDQTQKLPETDRKRCLRIVSKYICSHPDSDEVAEIPADIRAMVDEISVDRHFEELFTTKPQILTPSSSKRIKLDLPSPTLSTIGRNEKRVSEVLSRLASEGLAKVQDVLCKDNLAVRLVECFYITIYLPVMYECGGKTDLSVCLSSFFEMLFSHVKSQRNFKNKLLRDEPWVVENPLGLSRTSNRTVGTLRSFAYNNTSQYIDEPGDGTKIDVQVSIEKILDTFLDFAKLTPEVALDLLTQLLVTVDGGGFDARSALAQLLSKMLESAPRLVELGRSCVDQLYNLDGFVQTIEELKRSTLGSEAEQLCRLLHEETRIRSHGPDLFVLGCSDTKYEDMDVTMENKEFSIENLVSAFQKLSNWDELTYQQKRSVESELPLLWAERGLFKNLLSQYTDNTGWFGEIVQLSHSITKDSMKWLRVIDRWPRKHFVASAVIEATQYPKIQLDEFDVDKLQLPVDIRRSDCMVEWAVRLMVRALVTNNDNSEDEDVSRRLSRSHELVWCARANEMELHSSALSVIKRNHSELFEDEIIPWMEQKMIAYTMIGLKQNDSSYLERALRDATSLTEYYKYSNCESVIGVNKLIMQLSYRLKSLTPTDISKITKDVQSQLDGQNIDKSNKTKRNLADLFETAVLYFDECWSEEKNKDDILLRIAEYLGRLFQHNIDGASVAAILLNRLDDCDRIDDNTAKVILDKLKLVISNLPTCYMDQLKAKLSLFPAHLSRSSGIIELQDDTLDRYRRCLQLLCDADYLLMQYCNELETSLKNDDVSEWNKLFERMYSRIFDNPFAGTDYQALSKHKRAISTLKDADSFTRGIILKGCIQELEKQDQRETIRLSNLCPTLAQGFKGFQGSLGNGGGLAQLLGLPKGVAVVKFEEELRVFTDSKRRPTLICVVTSDGKRRRFLMKSEDLRADAAVQSIKTGHAHRHYTVIPLSEDCGLIEFLEDHKRVRDLMLSIRDVDVPIVRQSVKESELVLAPKSSSVQNYHEMCAKIPAYVLRSAIESHSSSLQDFILKKTRFLDSLSEITIVNWLFGLGDRHLHNVLYSIQDGRLQCIDWGAIFQYGGCELPPARLTRNLLAVCDMNVLEAKLQGILTGLRNSRQLLAPVLKLAFKWKSDFSDQFVYIHSILEGSMTSHEITKHVLEKTNRQHSNKYTQLLDSVFERHQKKDNYAVEEQISCLLRQCTDPWVLGVTRNGWEPWL